MYYLCGLLVKMINGNNQTKNKIIIHSIFYISDKKTLDISSLLCVNFQISHYKSRLKVCFSKCK